MTCYTCTNGFPIRDWHKQLRAEVLLTISCIFSSFQNTSITNSWKYIINDVSGLDPWLVWQTKRLSVIAKSEGFVHWQTECLSTIAFASVDRQFVCQCLSTIAFCMSWQTNCLSMSVNHRICISPDRRNPCQQPQGVEWDCWAFVLLTGILPVGDR